ncbi:MAG TPA: pyridoxal-dependent decarboxylase [Candidatus Baltobacteraceae bacterium]|jgi:glutamate/tyrosine decarboxylase-like PLP-dependent enzyme|nr:pyridoxal-dependent decarboxylase [Candidatus Baltobacteraceae bacterium]
MMIDDSPTLDPKDWGETRALGHRMLDDMIDHLARVREQPVWRRMPDESRAALRHARLPHEPGDLREAYAAFQTHVQRYTVGNIHPRFMGWVHGGGNVVGMLSEMLAGALNVNLAGWDQAPLEIERLVIRWAAEMLGFPSTAGGVLVTGSSLANLIGVLVARTSALGNDVRMRGVSNAPLRAYTSAQAHNCIARAMDMAGLGMEALRLIPSDAEGRMDLTVLSKTVADDREAGELPFLVVGTAGTVNTGAVDDLAALSLFCRREKLWFHIDAAFGAMAMLAPSLRPLLLGMSDADSVAFDFHKWMQAPYDAGCILVRDAAAQMGTFSSPAAYLKEEARGLSAGYPWPMDFGPDLSRGFRALKIWMMLQVYGTERLGCVVENTCMLAKALAARIDREPELERVAPVALNIVCFRYRANAGDLNRLNAAIVADLQESGVAAPSTTTLDGRVVIRAALVNHRTCREDIDIFVDAVLKFGRERSGRVVPLVLSYAQLAIPAFAEPYYAMAI